MIPETRGKNTRKYEFSETPVGLYRVIKDKKTAESFRNAAKFRGYKFAIRTIDNEIRAYRIK